MPPRITSPQGRIFTTHEEGGMVLHPYPDQGGLPTIGIGHLITPRDPWWDACQGILKQHLPRPQLEIALAKVATISVGDCEGIFTQDLHPCEGCINSVVQSPLTQAQFDMLVDFVFNEGTGSPKNSTWLRLLNQGNYSDAAKALLMWDKDDEGGKLVVDPDLLARRTREMSIFLNGYPIA